MGHEFKEIGIDDVPKNALTTRVHPESALNMLFVKHNQVDWVKNHVSGNQLTYFAMNTAIAFMIDWSCLTQAPLPKRHH